MTIAPSALQQVITGLSDVRGGPMDAHSHSSRRAVRSRCSGDDGASLVEYAVLLALISVVCIVAVGYLGNATSDKFSSVPGLLDPSAQSDPPATEVPTTVWHGDDD
jgi:Flp pilus assembly pilin Flp